LQHIFHSTHAAAAKVESDVTFAATHAGEWISSAATKHIAHLLFLVKFSSVFGCTNLLVSRLDALETFFRRGIVIAVGVVLSGEFSVGPFNLSIAGIFGHAEHAIGVGIGHENVSGLWVLRLQPDDLSTKVDFDWPYGPGDAVKWGRQVGR
jgi:hypothetical protein